MNDRRQVERWIGAVLAPEVRSPGTIASASEVVPSREYLERFPPALVVAFGRTPAGAVSPTPQLERVRAMCRELGENEPLVACDLEQGAGLHFAEGTRLPPALAIASAALSEGEFTIDGCRDTSTNHDHLIDIAGMITGHEARAFGVELVLAPVCDVNTRCDNPIIAVRSFGDDPKTVGERAWLFHSGLRQAGVLSCAKHFPGHGDTSQDSHIQLPRVDWDEPRLMEIALAPFRSLAGADAIMVAHLDVPALTGEPGLPCTLSKRVVEELLRCEVGFCGVVLTDAMNMGALAHQPNRYVRALEAGCDGLLCPHDALAAALELLAAVESGQLESARLEAAASGVRSLRDKHRALDADLALHPVPQGPNSSYAPLLADLALRCSPAPWPWERDGRCTVLDSLPSSETPEVTACLAELRSKLGAPNHFDRKLLPVICELRAWAGRYGLSPDDFGELERRIDSAARSSTKLALAWFGSPQTLPERLWNDPRVAIVLAFAPTPPMFAAVARWLADSSPPPRGSLPAKLG